MDHILLCTWPTDDRFSFFNNCECSHLKLGSTIRFPNISCIFFLTLFFFLILIFLNDVLENSGRVYLLLRVWGKGPFFLKKDSTICQLQQVLTQEHIGKSIVHKPGTGSYYKSPRTPGDLSSPCVCAEHQGCSPRGSAFSFLLFHSVKIKVLWNTQGSSSTALPAMG